MALKIHRGAFSKAWEDSFLGALRAGLSERLPHEETLVLVPTHLVGLHMRHRYAERFEGLYHVRFITFIELARRALIGKTPIQSFPSGSKEIYLDQALSNLPKDHPFFPMRDRKGFHRALLRQFSKWTEYAAEPGESLRAVREAFDQAHGGRYEDEPAWVLRASKLSAKEAGLESIRTLWVYGFYPMAPVQEAWIQTLSKSLDVQLWEHEIEKSKPLSLTLGSHADPTQEAKAVVRDVLEKVASGQSLEKMAIVVPNARDLSIYEEMLERACLPYYLPGGKPISDTPEGYAWQRLLDLMEEPWDRRDLMEVLAAHRFIVSTEDRGTVADWDAWTRASGIGQGAKGFSSILKALRRKPTSKGSDDPARASFHAWLTSFFEDAERLQDSFPNWKDASLAWQTVAKKHFSPTQVNQTVFDLLIGLTDLSGSGIEPSFKHIRTVLRARLERASISRGLFEKNGLLLSTPRAAQGMIFESLYLVCMTHDTYPKREFIPDWMKVEGLPGGSESILAYDALFCQGLAIKASYPRTDFLGKTQHPSPWVLERSGTVVHDAYLPWRGSEDTPIDASDWMNRTLSRALLSADATKVAGALGVFGPFFSSVSNWVEERLGQPTFGRYDGRIDEALRPSRYSAKHISDFSTCAYQYFLRRFVGLSKEKSPEEEFEVDRMERGNLIHEILFRLFTELRQEGKFPLQKSDATWVFARLDQVAKEVFSAATNMGGFENLWNHEKASILQDLKAFVMAEITTQGPWVPEAFEVRFGMPAKSEHEDATYSTTAPVPYDFGPGHVDLYGKIDRIDLSPDRHRFRVIDYKTGVKIRVRDDSLAGGTAVQLPLYLIAARAMFPNADFESSEAQLLSTSLAGGFARASFSARALLARESDLSTILSIVRLHHEKGSFPPNPGKGRKNCEICEFEPVCGKSIERIVERKKNDIAARDYFAMEEIV